MGDWTQRRQPLSDSTSLRRGHVFIALRAVGLLMAAGVAGNDDSAITRQDLQHRANAAVSVGDGSQIAVAHPAGCMAGDIRAAQVDEGKVEVVVLASGSARDRTCIDEMTPVWVLPE